LARQGSERIKDELYPRCNREPIRQIDYHDTRVGCWIGADVGKVAPSWVMSVRVCACA
jgi:hypothetical protein